MNNQNNVSPAEARNPIVTCPEERNLAETQDKDYIIAIILMFKDFNKYINKCLNKDHDNTNN